MPSAELLHDRTLVPPSRLAGLLAAKRQVTGASLIDLTEAAAGRFSVEQLEAVESGTVMVGDSDLRALAGLYGLDLGVVSPSRARLEVDADEGRLLVGAHAERFSPGEDDRAIMLRYLALVYRLRDAQPGVVIPARVGDLSVLAQVFGTSPEDVQRELEALMLRASPDIRFLHQQHRRRIAIPAIGILVALTVVGGLVLTARHDAATSAAAKAPAASTIRIGTPLVVDRVVDRDPGRATSVDIGAPLVIER